MCESFIRLIIDPEFHRMIPPLTRNEYDQLEKSLLSDGCRTPICTWNDVILDGHNLYEICLRKRIPFSVMAMDFPCREAAIIWICNNQIGRLSIAEETRRYLIGKRYKAEKIIGVPKPISINQHPPKVTHQLDAQPQRLASGNMIAITLGQEYQLSYSTVMRCVQYAESLDCIAEYDARLFSKLLSGQVKIPQYAVFQLSQMSNEELRQICNKLDRQNSETLPYHESRALLAGHIKRPNMRKGTIKEMPAYDPDAEFSSLALTVPSWCNSIDRVRMQANVKATSSQARYRLSYELKQLLFSLKRMQKAIKEDI